MPTTDISPFNILISCGSSSKLYLRRKRPTLVTRGSFSIFTNGWSCSLLRLDANTSSGMIKSSETSITPSSPIRKPSRSSSENPLGSVAVSSSDLYWFKSVSSFRCLSALIIHGAKLQKVKDVVIRSYSFCFINNRAFAFQSNCQ